MQIKAISIKDFMGIPDLALPLTAPVNILVGANEAGKSSIRDSILWCLTGTARGLKTHAEQSSVIREGAKFAEVSLTLADGSTLTRRKTPKSPATFTGELPDGGISPAILCDPYAFMRLGEDARREMLFKWVPGLDPNDAEIAGSIAAYLKTPVPDLETAKAINRLASVAASQGFPAAEKEAVAMRREAKRLKESLSLAPDPDTRATIGDRAYILPDVSAATVEKALKGLQAERDGLVKEQGKQEAQVAAATKRETAIFRLVADLKNAQNDPPEEPEEGLLQELQDTLLKDKAMLTECQMALQAASGTDPETFPAICPAIKREQAPCPRAGESIGSQAPDPAELEKLSGHVHEATAYYEATKAAFDKAAAMAKAWDGHQAKIAQLEADLSTLKAQAQEDAVNGEDLAEKIAALDARMETGQTLLNTVKAFWALKEKTDFAREQLAKVDQEITLYDALAKALAPDGIPSQMIAEALGPVNDLLGLAGGYLFPGRTLALTEDLRISLSGSPLLSKSAELRVGIAFQYALARLSNSRLLLIDEGDVLDPLNRAALVNFLLTIREQFDTVMVFATAPEASPSPVPEIQIWWVEAGRVTAVMERMAA